MARLQSSELSQSVPAFDWVLTGDGNSIVVPDAHLLFSGTFKKVGPDLVIEGDGKRALLPDYFGHGHNVDLQSVDGAHLDSSIVRALSGLDSPWVVAQAGGAGGPPEIGTVRKLAGSATVVRGANTQPLANGDPVYQGDVVQTGAASSLGIILKDNTVFSLSSDARMVMNQLVYDSSRTDNSMSMSLVQGSFVFITGQVAKTGTLSVSTPVATMGIRGTTPIVKLSALDGSGEFSLSADPNRAVGNYILYDLNGNEIARVGSTDITVRIQSAAGPFQTTTKTLAEASADNALVAPAFETFLLINQRGDLQNLRGETGKGQGSETYQLAFAVTNIDLLAETKLLDDQLLGTLEYLGASKANYTDVLTSQQTGRLSVDLDPTTPGNNRIVAFNENAAPLPVTAAAQITVPNGATTITSATVVLVNALPGDNMLVGALPPGITATITFGSIHVNLSGNGTAAQYIAAIEAIRFVNTSDNPSTDVREIVVTVVASNGETATATTEVTIQAVNDAPVNIVPEGQSANEDGSLIFATAHGNAITVTDPDAGTHALTTTLTVQHGSLTPGSSVAGVTVAGSGTGVLTLSGPQDLVNKALDGLTYHPNTDFKGTDSIVVSTTDNNTDGAQGAGGPLTTTSAGIEINITSVNDAPSGTDKTVTTEEDTSVALKVADFGFSDVHDTPPNSLLAVKITTLPESGTLTLDGYAVTAGQSVSAADIAAGKLVFTPNHDASGTTGFTFQVQDNGGTANGGTDLDPVAHTLSLVVTPVNDAPVAHDDAYYVREDHVLRVGPSYGVLTNDNDVDSPTITATLATGPQNGTLTLNPDGSFCYTPNHDFNGADSFTYVASDGIANSETATVQINVGAVNDAPIVTGPSGSLPTSNYAVEGLNSNFTPSEISTAVYQLTDAQQSLAGAVWEAIDLTQNWTWTTKVQLSSGYNPSGADGITFTLQSQGPDALTQLSTDGQSHDGGSLAVGGTFGTAGLVGAFGIWIDTFDNGLSIESSGNSISFFANDSAGATDLPPGASPHQLGSLLEDGQWHDLKITWDAATDTLSYQFTQTTTGETISGSQHFDPSTLPAGQTYFGFTASTGAASNDQFVEVVSVESPHAVEQTALSIKAIGFTVADVDAANGILTATLQIGDAYVGRLDATEGDSGITIVGGNGTDNLVIAGTVDQLNAFLGHNGTSTLTFTATQDNPVDSTSLTLTVNDNGNTGSGGPQSGYASTTIIIDAVNDAPVNCVPHYTQQVANSDSLLTFSYENGNAITVSDADAGNAHLTTTLSVGHGTIYIGSSSGSSLTVTGTQAEISTALDGLTYLPDEDYRGPDRLIVSTSDGGATGAGGAQTDTDKISIFVNGEYEEGYRNSDSGKAGVNSWDGNTASALTTEGSTFTGLGRAVDTVDFSSANFHDTRTVAFAADAPLRNPDYAVDILTNFDNTHNRVDLSSIFDALAPGQVNAGNIGDYVTATFDGTNVMVGASATAGVPFNVASIAGTAGTDHHAITAGDTISIVFDHASSAANVTVQGLHG